MTLTSVAQNSNESNSTTERIGIIQTMSSDGHGTLSDTQTGELKSFNLGSNPGASVIHVGSSVIYIDLPTPAAVTVGGKKGLNAVNVKQA